ncbi:MAG: Crp/Fnr family transcriptional regulator [Clostridia bacterium]|nr:Crp/Fnr family transcriptional regulator [Clostridia bacterium]
MPDHTLYQLFAETFPFWEGLTNADKEALVRSSYPVDFKKGTHIHDGNECTGVILVRSGNLRLYLLSSEGKEVTLYRLYGGDVCVLSASCVLDAITFDVSVDAEEDSACVVVGSCVLEELSRRIPQVKLFIMEIALSRFSDVMWVMQQILFMSMDKRLAIFLLDESAKTGSDTVKLTHEQIAKYMGSAREVVTRMLKYFSAEGMISATRGEGIKLLDKKRLRALAFQQL